MRLQSKVVVSIEFVADIEVILKEDLTALGSSTPEAALQETFFLMPIQFIIDGSDVFSQVNQATRFFLPTKKARRKSKISVSSDPSVSLCWILLFKDSKP